mmetsp:Transcript_13214/g.26686  ORF Transcript_13214/g.26686 Transcript_13214/m.26686 type:complete len:216 (+) Transcript_13214:257-904(+)
MKNSGRKVALHHFALGLFPCDLPVLLRELGKLCLVLSHIRRSQPLRLVHGLLTGTPYLHHSERRRCACHLRDRRRGDRHASLLLGNHLKELREVYAKEMLELLKLLRVQRLECGEVQRREQLLHHPRVRKITKRQAPLLRNFSVDAGEGLDHPLLLFGVPKEGWHVVVQVVQKEGMDFCKPRPLDKVVDLSDGRSAWELCYQGVEVVFLLLKELS